MLDYMKEFCGNCGHRSPTGDCRESVHVLVIPGAVGGALQVPGKVSFSFVTTYAKVGPQNPACSHIKEKVVIEGGG